MTAGPTEAQGSVQVCPWDGSGRLDELLALVHAAFEGLQPPSSVLRETLADLAERLRVETALIAQVGDEIVGSVFCASKGDALYLTRMAVAPIWRGRGVGSALLRAAADEARRIGGARLTLRVRQNLPGNRSYFERRGFVVIGEGREDDRAPYLAMEYVVR
ncbi:MAG: GNAT family N-acetyltransferase [Rhizobiales bacterium]|nr:GNAT family N-acetyltransferase [Hyphomicrobiales bacterium]